MNHEETVKLLTAFATFLKRASYTTSMLSMDIDLAMALSPEIAIDSEMGGKIENAIDDLVDKIVDAFNLSCPEVIGTPAEKLEYVAHLIPGDSGSYKKFLEGVASA